MGLIIWDISVDNNMKKVGNTIDLHNKLKNKLMHMRLAIYFLAFSMKNICLRVRKIKFLQKINKDREYILINEHKMENISPHASIYFPNLSHKLVYLF